MNPELLDTLLRSRLDDFTRGRAGMLTRCAPVPRVGLNEIKMPRDDARGIGVSTGDLVLVCLNPNEYLLGALLCLTVVDADDVAVPLVNRLAFTYLGLDIQTDFDYVAIFPVAPDQRASAWNYSPSVVLATGLRGTEAAAEPARYTLGDRDFSLEHGEFEQ